ncbi:lipopolysaccharide biosynthesis protein [Corallibacter vietnamensis]|uniref:Lipopolysaccharide biosynthesis protein n=1 Tax=Corallibacter vietnamensis TaxID=904130 RepID=A0ABP7GWK8_9FLAO
MSKGLKQKTFIGFLWLFAGSSTQTILQVIVLSILARLVVPAEFGVISIATVFIGFSRIFSQLGMGAAIVQKKVVTTCHIRTAFTTSLVIGTFFCVLIQVFANQIAVYFEIQELALVLKLISSIFIIDSFITISQALLQRKMRMKYFALTELISYAIGFGALGIVLAFYGYGVYALVFAYILQAIIRAIILSFFEPHSIIPYFNKKSFKDLFFYGSGQTIAKIANYVAGQGDNLIVGKMLTASDLGFYSRAFQLMVAPVNLIGQSLNIVLFPALASVQTDMKKVKNAFYKSTQLVAYASLIISGILIVNAREVVLILLGENWLQVVVPFQILAVGTIFRMSYKISDSLIKALGDVHRRAIVQIVYAICVFSFSYIGHFWGIKGVALGIFAAIFLNFVFMTHLSLLQFKDYWIKFILLYIKPLILSLVVFAFAYFTLSSLRLLALNIIITEILYLFIVFGFLIIVILWFKNTLGISNEVNLVLKKIKSKR